MGVTRTYLLGLHCTSLHTFMASAAIRPAIANTRYIQSKTFLRSVLSVRHPLRQQYSSMVQAAAAQQKGQSSETATLACGCFWSPVCCHRCCCCCHRDDVANRAIASACMQLSLSLLTSRNMPCIHFCPATIIYDYRTPNLPNWTGCYQLELATQVAVVLIPLTSQCAAAMAIQRQSKLSSIQSSYHTMDC